MSCRILSLGACVLFFISLAVAADDIHCPKDYMAVTRYGRPQCNQYVWRNITLDRYKSEFPLPMVRSEGWPKDTWTMCVHGVLMPPEKNFLVKLWRPYDEVSSVKAIYFQTNGGTVEMEEREEGRVIGRETISPQPYPFGLNKTFSLTLTVSRESITYQLCGSDTCATVQRYLPYSDIHTVQLFMQSRLHSLDLWCL